MHYSFRPLTEEDARAIVAWRYEGPYAIYNSEAESIPGLLDPRNAYYAIRSAKGDLIGFCCFGPDARVPGGEYDDTDRETLDVGLGLKPEFTRKGLGSKFFRAILEFGSREFAPAAFRLTVATLNGRAIRIYEKAGFKPSHVFLRTADQGEREFVQMMRAA